MVSIVTHHWQFLKVVDWAGKPAQFLSRGVGAYPRKFIPLKLDQLTISWARGKIPESTMVVPIIVPFAINYVYMVVSINGGTPKWMVYTGKPHFKIDDLGVALFYGNHPITVLVVAHLKLGNATPKRISVNVRSSSDFDVQRNMERNYRAPLLWKTHISYPFRTSALGFA